MCESRFRLHGLDVENLELELVPLLKLELSKFPLLKKFLYSGIGTWKITLSVSLWPYILFDTVEHDYIWSCFFFFFLDHQLFKLQHFARLCFVPLNIELQYVHACTCMFYVAMENSNQERRDHGNERRRLKRKVK